MDKLRPILKQRYWICFGLALIFVLVGWWNASGNLAAKTEERQKSVEGSFEKAKQGVSDPNADWVAAGKTENEQDLAAYKTASLQLWKRQQGARDWPEQIRSEMKSIKYFGEVENKETRERWADIYADQIDDLLSIVHPFNNANGEGLVVVDDGRITRQAYDKWKINSPTSNEIWSNQEDIWLLKALLSSIARTNDSATRITESQVREIKRLHLRGGDRNTKPPAPSGQAGGGLGGGNGMGMGMGNNSRVDKDDDEGGGMGGMAMGPAVAGMAGSSHPGSPFTGGGRGDVLAEEFGGTGGVGGLGAMVGSGNSRVDVDDDGKFGGGGMGAAAQKPEVRYVDGAEKDIGYKTRAFLLDVVIRDERLPDLLAKLTNSDFPVEIVRVEITPRTSGGSAMPGGGNMMSNVDDDDGSGPMRGFGNMAGMQAAFGGGYAGGGIPGAGGNAGGGSARRRDKGRDDSGGYSGVPGGRPGGMLSGIEAAKAAEALNAAFADPLLIEVHIGGLLTLYMTPEETEMQAKTEESAAKEEAAAPVVVDENANATDDPSGATPGTETPGTETPGTETPGTETPGAETPGAETPGTETTVPGDPNAGTDPVPAADDGEVKDSSGPGSSQPLEPGDPAKESTPAVEPAP